MQHSKAVRVACISLLILLSTLTTAAESKFTFDSTPGQLPKTVVPSHYAISIKPNLQTFTFDGSEVIDIEVRKATNTIVLNAFEVKISSAALVGSKGQNAKISFDEKLQTATLTFPRTVTAGRYQLELVFSGKIGGQSQGLYYVKYPTDAGERVMLATQMEPVDARRMFPGWDEPVFRATFQLTVTLPDNFVGVSNTPIEIESAAGAGLKAVKFGRTPKMSSYLVVLVAGELESLSGDAGGVQVRVITTKGKKDRGEYALEVARKCLAYYTEYFGLKYPLSKLDLIAIPGGFGGAMENWGGITFNEALLLFDPATSSQDAKETIFSVEAHEIAHMWFGDIVTMAWWDNLWLNEGFASWMATKATDHFNPGWNMWLRSNRSKNFVMERDARKTTHPIQQKVKDATEANRIFDEITYGKGEAFIRMLEEYLGETDFRAGIRAYMRKHQYSNTTTADLWDALEAASRKPVRKIAAGWTEQPGYPIVTAKTTCRDGLTEIALSQEPFTVNQTNPAPLVWQVPVSVSGGNGRNYSLLSAKSGKAIGGPCGSRLKLNTGNSGYYRVMYDPAIFGELKKSIRELPEADRLNLLGDTWALAEAARGPATDYLELAEALRDETTLALWEDVLTRLSFIDELEKGQPGLERFRQYARTFLSGVFSRVEWDAKPDEPKSTAQLRGRLIETLGTFGDQAVISEARKRFQAFLERTGSLSSELREPVFNVVGLHADKETFDRLHKLAREAQAFDEKRLLYGSMSLAIDQSLAEEFLKIVLTDEMPSEMAPYSIFGLAATGGHADLVWKFVQQHLKQLMAKLPEFAAISYVPSLFGTFSDSSRADELETFAKANLPEEVGPDIAKAVETIRFRAAFKQRELPRIDAWIARPS